MTSLQERWQLKTTWEKMMLRDLKRKIELGLSESEMDNFGSRKALKILHSWQPHGKKWITYLDKCVHVKVYDSFINNGFFLSEKIFPCNSHPCRSHATCIDGLSDPSNFTCKCPPWFTGKFCEGEFSDIPMGRFTFTVYLTSISLICLFGGNFEREIKKKLGPNFLV